MTASFIAIQTFALPADESHPWLAVAKYCGQQVTGKGESKEAAIALAVAELGRALTIDLEVRKS